MVSEVYFHRIDADPDAESTDYDHNHVWHFRNGTYSELDEVYALPNEPVYIMVQCIERQSGSRDAIIGYGSTPERARAQFELNAARVLVDESYNYVNWYGKESPVGEFYTASIDALLA